MALTRRCCTKAVKHRLTALGWCEASRPRPMPCLAACNRVNREPVDCKVRCAEARLPAVRGARMSRVVRGPLKGRSIDDARTRTRLTCCIPATTPRGISLAFARFSQRRICRRIAWGPTVRGMEKSPPQACERGATNHAGQFFCEARTSLAAEAEPSPTKLLPASCFLPQEILCSRWPLPPPAVMCLLANSGP